ncbi:MAG: ADP-ribosylglycohydrolase family protein [Thermoguttaceae bacterium]|jgi:ADP-ribosylglycohydrolase
MSGSRPSATPNGKALHRLFQTAGIDLVCGPLFGTPPEPLPESLDFGKVEGMMLGLAVGDGLGNTSEGMLPSDRRHRHGEVCDYLANRHAGGRHVGLPSDDSQLAFWTLEQMLADSGFVPANIAARFARDRIFGIGQAVSEFVENHRSGLPWHECGARSAGNGALMRIAPVIIPHLRSGTPELWVDTALAAMLTHNDAGSTAACLAFVALLWRLLAMTTPPPREWWLEAYVEVAKGLEGEKDYRPRGGQFRSYSGPLWQFVAQSVTEACRAGDSVLDACDRWYSGAYLLETVPSVIYILMQYGHDPEQAIIRAVNDTKDNDTIAAIIGAAVGALHGAAGLPARWIKNLLGRTTESDDGKVFELLAQAREEWR